MFQFPFHDAFKSPQKNHFNCKSIGVVEFWKLNDQFITLKSYSTQKKNYNRDLFEELF